MNKSRIVILSSLAQQFFLFEKVNIKVLKNLGFEVHGVASYKNVNERIEEVDIIHKHIDIKRSPFDLRNITAFIQLIKYVSDNNISHLHCHSPIGGVLGRLAKIFKPSLLVFYTAHGFHFYKGQSWLKNKFYFFTELLLSKLTDKLIVINQEDLVSSELLWCKKVYKIPGVGINTKLYNTGFSDSTRIRKRELIGITNSDFLLISVGELISRKNHIAILKALSRLPMQEIKLIICGRGELNDYLSNMIDSLGLTSRVTLLGYRTDIKDLMNISDCFIFPSFQEGLPVSLMEAMASGLPVIASRIRGNVDLIIEGENGYLFDPHSVIELAEKIDKIYSDRELRFKFKENNTLRIKNFDSSVVEQKMLNFYRDMGRTDD